MKRYKIGIFALLCIFTFGVVISCGGGGGSSAPPAPAPPPPPDPTTWSIIAVGDSITYGINGDNPDEEGYVPKLSRRLGTHVVNLGVPGALSEDVADNITKYLEKYHPTHVLVLAGANDTEMYPFDVMHYIHVMQYIVNTIRAYKAIPVVGTLTPFCHDKEDDMFTENIDARNRALHKYLEQDMSVTLADFAAVFTCDMMAHHNGIHPNSWGYEVMAKIWYETLMTDPKY